MQKRVYGHKKQGAAFGHTKIQGKSLLVRGLNALAATISTPLAAPVLAGTRLRGGNAGSARGAASFATASVTTARATGCSGLLVARADSAFYSAAFTGAVRAAGAFFSVTVRMDPKVKAAIAAIPDTAWTPVRYPRAIWDDQLRRWVSDAQVAEVPYTAFTSKKGAAVTARLIVRRVKDLNRKAGEGQDELFCAWRYHAVFTDSPFATLQAEEQHRDHARVEQDFADLTDGPLARLPSGSARSPCTCPKAGTARPNGPASSRPLAARPPPRPDQPRPGQRTYGPRGPPGTTPASIPGKDKRTSRKNVSGRKPTSTATPRSLPDGLGPRKAIT